MNPSKHVILFTLRHLMKNSELTSGFGSEKLLIQKGFDVNRSLLFLRIFFCFCEYDGSLSDERKFKEGLSICPDYFIGDFKQNLKVK